MQLRVKLYRGDELNVAVIVIIAIIEAWRLEKNWIGNTSDSELVSV